MAETFSRDKPARSAELMSRRSFLAGSGATAVTVATLGLAGVAGAEEPTNQPDSGTTINPAPTNQPDSGTTINPAPTDQPSQNSTDQPPAAQGSTTEDFTQQQTETDFPDVPTYEKLIRKIFRAQPHTEIPYEQLTLFWQHMIEFFGFTYESLLGWRIQRIPTYVAYTSAEFASDTLLSLIKPELEEITGLALGNASGHYKRAKEIDWEYFLTSLSPSARVTFVQSELPFYIRKAWPEECRFRAPATMYARRKVRLGQNTSSTDLLASTLSSLVFALAHNRYGADGNIKFSKEHFHLRAFKSGFIYYAAGTNSGGDTAVMTHALGNSFLCESERPLAKRMVAKQAR